MSRPPNRSEKTEQEAATAFVEHLEMKADGRDEHGAPYWFGWALWEAFMAGANWGKLFIIGQFRQRIKERAK